MDSTQIGTLLLHLLQELLEVVNVRPVVARERAKARDDAVAGGDEAGSRDAAAREEGAVLEGTRHLDADEDWKWDG